METVQSHSYEVRCPRCDCSFAPGTRVCVHCGDRIGGRFRIPGGAVDGGGELEMGEDVEIGSARFLRWALWAFSVAVAVLMSLARACSE